MKKLFFIVSIFFLSVTSSFAVFFAEGEGGYMTTGKYDPVTGFGGGIGVGLTDDINIIIRAFKADYTNADDTIRTDYFAVTGGIEYIPPVAGLEQLRVYWKNSLNIGMADFMYEDDTDSTKKREGKGIMVSFKTGLQYNFTQIVSPYFDFGFHKSFYSKQDDISEAGWQIDLGVRFYAFGSRDYESGY